MSFANFFTKEGVKAFWHDVCYKSNEIKPEVMLITGGLSLLAGTIVACYRTEKAKIAYKEAKTEIDSVTKSLEDGKTRANGDKIVLKQVKTEAGKDYVKAYWRLFYQFLKIYGVPALLWFGGFGLITYGHTELRRRNTALAGQLVASSSLFKEYRDRVAQTIGTENEQKIYAGAVPDTVKIIEKDPETGEKKVTEKSADVFIHQPGSIFARNFTEETSDCFDTAYFAENLLEARIEALNMRLEQGSPRCYTGLDVYKALGFNENELGSDEEYDALLLNGISGNARKVPDPEMRKIKYTMLKGYQKRYDEATGEFVWEECIRLDWNFYPLQGRV